MLVRSCFLITVIKGLKGHRTLGSLFNVKKGGQSPIDSGVQLHLLLFSALFSLKSYLFGKCPNLFQWYIYIYIVITWKPLFKFLWHTTVLVWSDVLTWKSLLQKTSAYKCCQLPVSGVLQDSQVLLKLSVIKFCRQVSQSTACTQVSEHMCCQVPLINLTPAPATREASQVVFFSDKVDPTFLIKWIRLFWLSGSDFSD